MTTQRPTTQGAAEAGAAGAAGAPDSDASAGSGAEAGSSEAGGAAGETSQPGAAGATHDEQLAQWARLRHESRSPTRWRRSAAALELRPVAEAGLDLPRQGRALRGRARRARRGEPEEARGAVRGQADTAPLSLLDFKSNSNDSRAATRYKISAGQGQGSSMEMSVTFSCEVSPRADPASAARPASSTATARLLGAIAGNEYTRGDELRSRPPIQAHPPRLAAVR